MIRIATQAATRTNLCRLAMIALVAAYGLPGPAVAAEKSPKTRPIIDNRLDSAAQRQIAKRMLGAGSPALAAQLLGALVQQNPKDPSLRLEYAQALSAAGKFDDALGEFVALADVEDVKAAAAAGAMRAHLETGAPEKAVEATQTLSDAQMTSQHYLLKGTALDRLQRHPEAQAAYRAGLKLSPRSVGLRNNLALSLALTGNHAEAAELLRVLAASSDASPRIRQNLALVYGLMGKREQSAALAAVDLTPDQVANNKLFFQQLQP